MSKISDAQRKWLVDLDSLAGGGDGDSLKSLLAEPPGDSDPTAIADVIAGQGAVKADAPGGTPQLPKAAKPAVNSFVPDLAITGGNKRDLAIAGNVTLELKVRNWEKRPKDTKLNWSVTSSDKAVDFEFENLGGEGLLKVTGHFAGKGVVKVEVKVVGGGTFRFPDAVFTVTPTAKSATTWIPKLDAPRTVNTEIAVKEKVALLLKVNNWDQRPKGTILNWSAQVSSNAVDIELEHRDGDGTVTVTGAGVGGGVVKASVQVQGGGTYPFWDTEYKVIQDKDPNRSVDRGGVADSTNLEQDMRNILQDWHSAARAGISQFVTNELSKRIDKLESGSAKNFLFALVGNIVWAAACFTTGGAAFAISLTGIGIGAVPGIPQESKSFIPAVQKAMEDHIDGIFDQLDSSLRNKAKLLVDKFPGITRFHAMNEFVGASFKAPYITLNSKHTTIPTLVKPAIRDQFVTLATQKLEVEIKAEEARKAAEKAKRAEEAANRRVYRR